ncbi:hypothetical protein [Nonomuraea sp. LPB2021202275-12-8]|uniref:hypothetical protein n=1 Tax=Nonomuraea sp. LPB2021202275-12-8 TaxID=3120159 RepID=UPI00300CE3AB
MKRTVVGVILIAGLAQLVAAPAQAAPGANPVTALRATLIRGKGVNIVSTAKVDHGRGVYYTLNLDGMVGFGPQGEIASDTSQRLQYSKATKSALAELDMARTPPWKRRP